MYSQTGVRSCDEGAGPLAHRRILWIGQECDTSFISHGVSKVSDCFFHSVVSMTEALSWLSNHNSDVVLLDLDYIDICPKKEVAALAKMAGSSVVLVIANPQQGAMVADALHCGAIDYLIKPFGPRQLVDAICSAIGHESQTDLIAVSKVSRQVLQLARRAAKTTASVMISGESGTGKERLARYIHDTSPRADKPFIAINCAAIPESMLESILFGHAKGAFTGAVVAQAGKFELANGGTLLLDEISELPLLLQAKLLRVLQEKEVERLGSHRLIPLDVRIIAASNRDLRELVAKGEFREDLYYRLDVLPLSWPALRERPEDIQPLAEFFLRRHAPSAGYHLTQEATGCLLAYHWPGNVRELENVIQRALVMARGLHILPADLMLPALMSAANDHENLRFIAPEGLSETRRHAEFRYVLDALRSCDGHRAKTAAALGMTTRALRYKLAAMREQGIDVERLIQG